MNDARFFDLAVKAIAHQASEAERTDLEAMLADKPELRAEFMRLEKDALVAKDVLPLVAACTASTGQFPAYARERLQTTVRQTLGRPKSAGREPSGGLVPAPHFMPEFPARRLYMPRDETDQPATMRPNLPNRGLGWGWRWVLGLAIATAVVLLLALPVFRTTNEPVIQLAVLDTVGGTRGTGTNELATLKEAWKGSPVQTFSNASELEAWEQKWPNYYGRPAAKIIYDPAAGEIRVSGHSQGKAFQKTFPLEKDLATTLRQVSTFVREQTKR